jgi:hypothetical protein
MKLKNLSKLNPKLLKTKYFIISDKKSQATPMLIKLTKKHIEFVSADTPTHSYTLEDFVHLFAQQALSKSNNITKEKYNMLKTLWTER